GGHRGDGASARVSHHTRKHSGPRAVHCGEPGTAPSPPGQTCGGPCLASRNVEPGPQSFHARTWDSRGGASGGLALASTRPERQEHRPPFGRNSGADDTVEAARRIAGLDLLISVDSMPAHL